MVLSSAEATAKLKTPTNKAAISEALVWQAHLRFHGLVVKDKQASGYWSRYRSWVHQRITIPEKQNAFDATFQFPVVTNRLLAEVHDGWMKVFDAANPVLTIQGGEGVAEDLEEYLKQSGEADFWYNQAISALLESPNDFVVIDVRQADGRREPYLERLALDSVIDVVIKADGTCEYIAYWESGGRIVFIDDEHYRLYSVAEGVYTLEAEVPHPLGYCPARLLWDERIPGHGVATASPIDDVLSHLDRYTYRDTTLEIYSDTGLWPVSYGLEAEEEDPLVYPLTGDPGIDGCEVKPKGGGAKLVLGDHYDIPLKAFQQGGIDPRPPIGYVAPDIQTGKLHAEWMQALADDIVQYLLGSGGESLLRKAQVNEKQVSSTFTGKENALRYLSSHLSAARQWVVETFGRLRHGVLFDACEHSFGTEFYLKTDAEQLADIQAAKDSGLPVSLILQLIESYQRYRLRAVPGQAGRTKVLQDLEPLFPLSLADAQELLAQGLVDRKSVAVKAQFYGLISQFERERQVSVQEWGSLLTYSTKIEAITTYLFEHVRYDETNPASGNAGSQTGGFGAVNRPDAGADGAAAAGVSQTQRAAV